MIWYYK